MCSNLVPARTSRLFLHRLLFCNLFVCMHDLHTICTLLLKFLTDVSTELHDVFCLNRSHKRPPIYVLPFTVPCPYRLSFAFARTLIFCFDLLTRVAFTTLCASIRRRVPSTRACLTDDHVPIVLHIVTLATSARFGLRWSQYDLRLGLVYGNKLTRSLCSHVYYSRSKSDRRSPLVWEPRSPIF